MLAIIDALSLTGSSGGVIGTEVASVGEYALGGESCEGLDAFGTSFWAPWESGREATLSGLATVAPLIESRLGSLSDVMASAIGVRARCVASGPDEAKPRDGTRGREVDPFCGVPVIGSSVEGRGGSAEGALEFDSLGATF
jgi:hypothetical protein